MKLIKKTYDAICHIFNEVKYVSPWWTLYLNMRLFPFKKAIRFPILFGYRMDFRNIVRGSIVLSNKPRVGLIEIGISRYPTFPVKHTSTLIRLQPGSKLVLGDHVRIASGCGIVASCDGVITIGKDVFINQGTIIYSNESVSIGNHVRIGWKSQIYDSPVHFTVEVGCDHISDPRKPVIIYDNVWIANHVTVAAGAVIPAFAIVGSHSLVNKEFTENGGGILRGAPAKWYDCKKVRVLNEELEWIVKKYFAKEDVTHAKLSDYGFTSIPLDGDLNPLYRSRTSF